MKEFKDEKEKEKIKNIIKEEKEIDAKFKTPEVNAEINNPLATPIPLSSKDGV